MTALSWTMRSGRSFGLIVRPLTQLVSQKKGVAHATVAEEAVAATPALHPCVASVPSSDRGGF